MVAPPKAQQKTPDEAATFAPIERVKAFFGMHDAQPNSRGFYSPACCPAHDDKRPSMSYWETPSGGVGFHCQAGCTPDAIRAALKLDLRPTNGYQPVYRPQTASISLIELAQAKKLDWQMLLNWGVTDDYRLPPEWRSKYNAGQDCIRISYRDRAGEEITKIRIRTGTSGHDGCWIAETPGEIIPYGLWKLEEAETAGYLCVVEGESDCWTLWSYGLPALGVPGANLTKCLDGQTLAGIKKIYIFQEPDQEQKAASLDRAAQGFYSGVYRQLRNTGYKGSLYQVRFKRLTGSKDPNDLHQKLYLKSCDLTQFQPALAHALSQADPANDETEEIQSVLSVIEKALAEQNIRVIYEQAHTLAALPSLEYALLKLRIKEALGSKINLNDLERIVNEARPSKTTGNAYARTDPGMVHISNLDGSRTILSNFAAEIIADVKTDDGAESSRSYAIQAMLGGRQTNFEVLAKDFSKCDWVDEHIGARATVTPGQSMRGHLINAIKSCSDPEVVTHYSHTGWRKIGGQMVYLHANGYVQAGFQNTETRPFLFGKSVLQEALRSSKIEPVSESQEKSCVRLSGPLAKFAFDEASPAFDIQAAIRASLGFTNLAADTVTMPLYAALWRSVLGEVNFGIHLAGQTGWGKSELAALLQQSFGSLMTAHELPGSWESTENSLEMLLFQAKDTLLVVDDFKPKGGKVDQDRLHAKADRVFRQIGNGSARGRLTSTLEQRAERRPRCLLLSTGEDIPRGQSLKARGVVLLLEQRITTGESAKRLSVAQKHARDGLYAQTMAAYLQWLAPRIERIQQQMADLVAEEREQLNIDGHARSSTNTAHLLLGMKCFLQFAHEACAISEEEAHALLKRCIVALEQIAQEAARENTEEKPTEHWKHLVLAALQSKRAHLVNADGSFPGLEYGWLKSVRLVEREEGIVEEEMFSGGGDQIGWIDGKDIYLDPTAAYKVARMMGSAIGDDLTTLERTLRKFLVQDGLLVSTDQGNARKTITVRRRLNGVRCEVLHLSKAVFYPDETPDPPTPKTAEESRGSEPDEQHPPTPVVEQEKPAATPDPTEVEQSKPTNEQEEHKVVHMKKRIESFALARSYPKATLSDGTTIPTGVQAWNGFLKWQEHKWPLAFEDICQSRITIEV